MNTNRDNVPKDDTMSMNDCYLWDGSGEPDPRLQHLETMLGQFRHSGVPLALPREAILQPSKLHTLTLRTPWLPRAAASLVVAVSLVASVFLTLIPTRKLQPQNSWDVECLRGEIRVGTSYVTADQASAKMDVGQVLETDGVSRASISEKSFGQIDIEPGSRVQLEQSGDNRTRIQLDRGTIHAAIWAPPGQFVVDTPSAVAVDLGCAYTLQVSPDGSGSIRTTLGWVGFHLNGRESFIPTGAMCATRPHVGPGTPYFEDTAAAFRNALADFDFTAESKELRASALASVLTQARAKDGLTLWHLLSRTDGQERAKVYDRFATLVPPPQGVTRDSILRLDQSMLDLWWNSLDLGDISIWRFWEQSTSPRARLGTPFLQEEQTSLPPAR
jgi:hypothetical protein